MQLIYPPLLKGDSPELLKIETNPGADGGPSKSLVEGDLGMLAEF